MELIRTGSPLTCNLQRPNESRIPYNGISRSAALCGVQTNQHAHAAFLNQSPNLHASAAQPAHVHIMRTVRHAAHGCTLHTHRLYCSTASIGSARGTGQRSSVTAAPHRSMCGHKLLPAQMLHMARSGEAIQCTPRRSKWSPARTAVTHKPGAMTSHSEDVRHARARNSP